MINQDIIDDFFFGIDPVGETLYISGIPFYVVGVFSDENTESLASAFTGSSDILIPYTTALKMNNEGEVTSFTVYLADGVDSDTAADKIEDKMDAMFSYEDDCFTITMSSVEDTMNEMLSMMTMLLAGIASIALVVGGIGIMNMMLTTVTERTVEIGLKKPWAQSRGRFRFSS